MPIAKGHFMLTRFAVAFVALVAFSVPSANLSAAQNAAQPPPCPHTFQNTATATGTEEILLGDSCHQAALSVSAQAMAVAVTDDLAQATCEGRLKGCRKGETCAAILPGNLVSSTAGNLVVENLPDGLHKRCSVTVTVIYQYTCVCR